MLLSSLLSMIFPFTIFMVGIYLRRNYHVKIGSSGFSVPAAKENEDKWLYAQIIGPKVALEFALGSAIVSALAIILGIIFGVSADNMIYIGCSIGVIALIAMLCTLQGKVAEFTLVSSHETTDADNILWREAVSKLMLEHQTEKLEKLIEERDFSRNTLEKYI